MIKQSILLSLTLACTLLFTSCAKDYTTAKKVLPTLLDSANECRNDSNKEFELDCYDLIAYKNSIALLRLAVNNYKKANYKEAAKQITYVFNENNFYANSVMSDILKQTAKTNEDKMKAISLLEEVKLVDPIASYKLYYYYVYINKNQDAIKVLSFAANNHVKEAQIELSKLYANAQDNKLVKGDLALSIYWLKEAQSSKRDFVYEIYGIKDYFK